MQFESALEFTREELTQSQAHALSDVLHLRRQLLADQQNALVSARVTVGATVKVRQNIKQAYLRGLTGTVQAKNGKVATVLLDEESTARLSSGKASRSIWIPEGTTRHPLDGMPVAALDVLDAPDGFDDLVTFLVSHATAQQITEVETGRKKRIQTLAESLAAGDVVMITNVSPKFLVGLTGTVQSVDKAAGGCRVLLDENSTKQLRLEDSSRFHVENGVTHYPIRLKFEQALITSQAS
ncbi:MULTISPECIES: hypothetical protein [Amycolatopsis]|uniref:Uncharacterized protein n=1 Tax=Amycolatopsis saalfeldensis TaxID=394193 RepID=A0A1H8YQF2_9PSEU|nr:MULTISPECIES: hypothetical protein [Amycolatopsis]SEP54445.1 hypothetical protein SAMN04489732_14721 [Amycolatopsis saalfeldensis]